MTSEVRASENNILENLKLANEARGFSFHLNPPPAMVPSFLRGYRPDAIVLRPEGGGIIIEINHQKTGGSETALAQIARRVAAHKGWEFQVIYMNPAPQASAPIPRPTADQVQAALGRLQELSQTGHHAAALVTGWAIMESLARLVLPDSDFNRTGTFSSIQTVQTLAEEGYLENEAAQRLREMARLRNAVVHGNLSTDVSADQVRDLLDQLQAIATDISQVNANQAADSEAAHHRQLSC